MSDEAPLLSIVTMCKNAGETIEHTLKSIESQTSKAFEYIVIDAASKDNTGEILAKYDAVIDRCISEPDENSYEAFNKSLAIARGSYVAFLCADDWFESTAAEEIIGAIRVNPGVDLIGYELLEHNESASGEAMPQKLFSEPDKAFDIQTGLYCHGINRAYKRQLLVDLGAFQYHDYPNMADRDLHIKLGMRPSTKYFIPKPLYHFRVHEGSRTTNGNLNYNVDAMQEYKNIAIAHIENSSNPEVVPVLKYWYGYASIRQSFFLAKQGRVFKALQTSVCDFLKYPASFVMAVFKPLTPLPMRPKKIV